jgi:hypothetical protein
MTRAAGRMVILLLLPGCAVDVKQVRVELHPKPMTCEVSEVRPSGLSTFVSGVCWDGQGNMIGMGGAGGKASVSVPLDLFSSVAAIAGPVGAAYILGSSLVKAARNVEVTGKGTVDLNNKQIQDAIADYCATHSCSAR